MLFTFAAALRGPDNLRKTPKSERRLPMPASLLARLRLLGGTDWVFRNRDNGPINPGTRSSATCGPS